MTVSANRRRYAIHSLHLSVRIGTDLSLTQRVRFRFTPLNIHTRTRLSVRTGSMWYLHQTEVDTLKSTRRLLGVKSLQGVESCEVRKVVHDDTATFKL